MNNSKFTPNTIVAFFAFTALASWLIDTILNKRFTHIGFVYFITGFVFLFFWKTEKINQKEILSEICKKILIGVGTTCILAFFAAIFNQPIGDFFLKKYVEGKLIEEVRQQQAAGNYQGVLRLTDPQSMKGYAGFTEETLKNIRRISEDAVMVAGSDTAIVKQQ